MQIGTYCANLTGVDIHEFIQENGEEVQKISYTDLADFKQKLKDIIKFLRAGKIDLRDVTFLAPKTYAKSILSAVDLEVNELGDRFDPASKLPNFATIQGFKGLDSKIVILVDVEAIKPENFAKYMYIAGTRARTLLIVVGAESFWAQHKG